MQKKPSTKRSLKRRQEGDSERFDAANDMLEAMKVFYKRTSADQLKIRDINFYPNTGTIKIDDERKSRREKGLEELKRLLEERRKRLDDLLK